MKKTEDKSEKSLLFIIFTIQILLFIYYLPIFALSGMAFSSPPTFSSGNITMAIFDLYPVWIVIAIIISYRFTSLRKYGSAIIISLMPPIISALGLFAFATIDNNPERPSSRELAHVQHELHQKCQHTGETIYLYPTETIDSLFIEDTLPYSLNGVTDGKYDSNHGGTNFYGLLIGGFLRQVEVPNRRSTQHVKPYRRCTADNLDGVQIDKLSSKYGMRYINKVSANELSLGMRGGTLQLYRIADNFILAENTSFMSSWTHEACGFAPDGFLNTNVFLKKIFKLKVDTYRQFSKQN